MAIFPSIPESHLRNYRGFLGFLADFEATTSATIKATMDKSASSKSHFLMPEKHCLRAITLDILFFLSYLLLSMPIQYLFFFPINSNNFGIQENLSFWLRHSPDVSSSLKQPKQNKTYDTTVLKTMDIRKQRR